MSHAQLGAGPIPARWTDEVDAALAAYWQEGLTASVIAERLTARGFEVSRSAVLGRSFRLRGGKALKSETRPPVDQIGPDGCRWIDGDPRIDPRNCGAAQYHLSPYCAKHYAMAHKREEDKAPGSGGFDAAQVSA